VVKQSTADGHSPPADVCARCHKVPTLLLLHILSSVTRKTRRAGGKRRDHRGRHPSTGDRISRRRFSSIARYERTPAIARALAVALGRSIRRQRHHPPQPRERLTGCASGFSLRTARAFTCPRAFHRRLSRARTCHALLFVLPCRRLCSAAVPLVCAKLRARAHGVPAVPLPSPATASHCCPRTSRSTHFSISFSGRIIQDVTSAFPPAL